MQKQALGRIDRLRKPPKHAENERGRLVVFSSAKPGSGASTLACQTAFALSKLSGKRVLLADFDLCNGSVAFFFKISPFYSILDALRQIEEKGESDWSSLGASTEGVDVLAAPDLPAEAAGDEDKLHEVLESVAQAYDRSGNDLPAVCVKLSLA